MRKNYRIKKTISMKKFISELGENFSEHMKNRLLELEIRCVLTRKDCSNILDLKHVEHTKYKCDSEDISTTCEKEYVYAQFVVVEGGLYFSEKCTESDNVMQSPVVDTIYNSLNSENMIFEEERHAKKVDDSNIDYVIDTILAACPQVSQYYINVVHEMLSHERK